MIAPHSPYRAADGCEHARIVERTCDAAFAPFLTPSGAVDCHVIVRVREWECAGCGVEMPPRSDAERLAAVRVPRCSFPHCNCLDADDWARDPHPRFASAVPAGGANG